MSLARQRSDELGVSRAPAQQDRPERVAGHPAGIDEALAHRRDERDTGDPVVVHHAGRLARLELPLDDDRRSVQRRPDKRRQPAHVVGRETDQPAVLRDDAQPERRGGRARDEVPQRQADALWLARRSRGEQNQGSLVFR